MEDRDYVALVGCALFIAFVVWLHFKNEACLNAGGTLVHNSAVFSFDPYICIVGPKPDLVFP